MAPEFDMKKVTTPLLLHMLGKEMRFPRLFLLRCKFTLGRFKETIDKRFPRELIDLGALPAWVYLNLKRKIGQHRAFEIMRVALLTGGTATQNLQFDTVHKERNFQNFSELEIENNRTGLVRWNKMEIVERSARRFEIKITRCMFHEFAISVGLPELTPVVCQIDNAMFNSYLPDEMTFDRGLLGGRIADGKPECNFVWEVHKRPGSPVEGSNDRATPPIAVPTPATAPEPSHIAPWSADSQGTEQKDKADSVAAPLAALAKDVTRSSEETSKEIRELFGPASIPPVKPRITLSFRP